MALEKTAEAKPPVKPVKPDKDESIVINGPVKPRKARAKLPENESKSDRFRRVASMRVNKAVKYIDALAFVVNKATYEYTDEQLAKIISELSKSVASVKAVYEGKKEDKSKFSL